MAIRWLRQQNSLRSSKKAMRVAVGGLLVSGLILPTAIGGAFADETVSNDSVITEEASSGANTSELGMVVDETVPNDGNVSNEGTPTGDGATSDEGAVSEEVAPDATSGSQSGVDGATDESASKGSLVEKNAVPAAAVPAAASDPVEFKDANLKQCVARKLGVAATAQITQADMARIQSLDCSFTQILNIAPLQYATNMTTLNLYATSIIDITPLKNLTQLTSLDLGENQLIVDVSSLRLLTNLTNLDLSTNGISDISPLSGLVNLKSLVLQSNKIDNLSSLRNMTGLETLILSENNISDLSPLSGMTRLKTLMVDSNKISNISTLAGLTLLEELELSYNQITDITALRNLTALQSLYLTKNGISDLSPLKTLIKMRSLNVARNQVSDISPLKDMNKVYRLDLRENAISDISATRTMTSLEIVTLTSNQVADLSPLSGLGTIENLYIANNRVSDLSPLASLSKLRDLQATGQAVTLPDARSGQAFALPVKAINGSVVPVTIKSGTGQVSGGSVTWNMPSGGTGTMEWSKSLTVGLNPAQFSGTLTQNVLPVGAPETVTVAAPTRSANNISLDFAGGKVFWTKNIYVGGQLIGTGRVSVNPVMILPSQRVCLSVGTDQDLIITNQAAMTNVCFDYIDQAFAVAPNPTISGNAVVGSTLTAQTGSWSPTPSSYSYRWLRDGSAISGATSSSYGLVAADEGKKISVEVTARLNGYVTTARTSAAVTVSATAPLEFAVAPNPAISGNAMVGSTVTAQTGNWSPVPASYAYQWLRDGSAISGATSSSYGLVAADQGKKISVEVTARLVGYVTTTRTSAEVTVAAAPPQEFVTAPNPTISGNAVVGSTVTAQTGSWSPVPASYAYRWLRDGSAISGATSSTYVLVAADEGTKVSVEVTARLIGYVTTTRTSATVTVSPEPKNGWVLDGGKWYYYTNGTPATGWLLASGKWYYMNSSGVMQTGWIFVSGSWYYMNPPSGDMATGWKQVGGAWYYMNSSGVMQTGWVLVSGSWYYMNSSGVMQTGWVLVNGKWYFLNSSGVWIP